MVAPNIAQDDKTTNIQGFYTLQKQEQRKEDITNTVSHDNMQNTTDTLSMLYAKTAKRQDMNLHDYCTHIHNLTTNQHHIEIEHGARVTKNALRHGKKNKKDTECFSVARAGQAKVMLYISYKGTCFTFSNTH